ncbi:Ulp1 protease family, C-terminal catalytic domain [Sesbania bispinosa]|nr:Ulp1 protease family, C-terminal catalytic domain [Sesbania bispinosa]
MGYAQVEKKLVKEAGSNVTSIPCHQLHKSGVIDNENVQPVLDQSSVPQGNIQNCGREDILGKALKVPEHSGKVRDMGYGVCQKDSTPCQKRSKQVSLHELRTMRQEINDLHARVDRLVKKTHSVQLQRLVKQTHSVQQQALMSCTRGKDSYTLAKILQTPAESRVNDKDTGHTKESIPSTKKKLMSGPIFPINGPNDLPFCKFLTGFVKSIIREGEQFEVPMHKDIFNYEYDERFGKDEINEVLNHEFLSNFVVCIYVRYLYNDILVPNQLTNRFSFLNPSQTSPVTKGQCQYVSKVLMDRNHHNKLFLAPYISKNHWVLVVINATANIIYYLDSLHGDPLQCLNMKNMFDT